MASTALPQWEAVLPLVLPHLCQQEDRSAVRLVSREWRLAADTAWQAGCLNCFLLLNGPPPCHQAAVAARLAPNSFPLPTLQELCLAELMTAEQLKAVLGAIRQLARQPPPLPALRRLSLSTAVGQRLCDDGLLAELRMTQLQSLMLEGITLQSGLAGLTHLTGLTRLAIGLNHAAGAPAQRCQVCRLTALQRLQALALPGLEEGERNALSALTGLTSLSFTAVGKGAVGPSLLPLANLQELRIALAHTHDRFIVLHPRVEWSALRALSSLRHVSIDHLATYSFFPAPEAAWNQDAPVAAELDALLAALPSIETVQLRLSFCRLLDEHATPEGQPERLQVPHPPAGSGSGPHPARTFLRSIERVPKRYPSCRRSDAWHELWWQPAVQAQLEAAAAEFAARFSSAAEVAAALAQQRLSASQFAIVALQPRRREVTEVEGWTAIRPGSYRTHDTMVTCRQARKLDNIA